MNTAVFKLPLGMIRIIELPMSILAFATTSGYSASQTFNIADTTPVKTCTVSFGYPFSASSLDCCKDVISESFKSSSEFFVFTGVMSFLYVLAIIALYLLLWSSYENDSRFAMVDFIATAVFTLFWFAGSCAWASGVSGLKGITGKPLCTHCKFTGEPTWNYASLNVSLIAGFACCALWGANLWFIYKETAWFKARAAAGAGAAPGAGAAGMPQPGGAGGYSGQTTPQYP